MTVTTCDAQGKPVSAQVSLALLPTERTDRELSVGQWLPHTPGDATQLQTASSIQFHYQPANRVIGPAEPEEDAPVIPSHISPQVGIPVGRPLPADADPFGDSPAAPAASARRDESMPSADPFGDDSEQPTAKLAPAVRSRLNVRSARGFGCRANCSPDVARLLESGHHHRAGWPRHGYPDLAGRCRQPDARGEGDHARYPHRPGIAEIVLKKDLSAVIHLPSALTDGDEVELPVVVENQVIESGKLEVTLEASIDGVKTSERKVLDVKSRGRLETSFKTTIRQVQRPSQESGFLPLRPQAEFTVTVKAGSQSNVCRRSAPIVPYGTPCRVTVAGAGEVGVTVKIAPSRPHWTAPTLQIDVSPTIQRSLLDLLEAGSGEHGAGSTERDEVFIGTEGLPAASDLMAALALKKVYPADSPVQRTLDERINASLTLLIAGQQDGMWSIDGRLCNMVATHAVAHWALVLADKAGFEVPKEVLDSALQRLRGGATADQEGDLETKAIVLHALAISGKGDFALANQLLRDRKLLSPWSRAYLALALLQMDRKETAADVMSGWSTGFSRSTAETPPKGGTPAGNVEAQAVTALALLGLDPASTQAKGLIENILSQRSGLCWTPERATGPAVLAVAAALAKEKTPAGPYHLSIVVNGKPVKTLDLDPQGPTQTVDVPMAMLVPGEQRIELHASDPARFAYRSTLRGSIRRSSRKAARLPGAFGGAMSRARWRSRKPPSPAVSAPFPAMCGVRSSAIA